MGWQTHTPGASHRGIAGVPAGPRRHTGGIRTATGRFCPFLGAGNTTYSLWVCEPQVRILVSDGWGITAFSQMNGAAALVEALPGKVLTTAQSPNIPVALVLIGMVYRVL